MSPDEAPTGTLCTVGHPMNGVVARKNEQDKWVVLNTGQELDYDSVHKTMTAIYIPEV